MRKILLLIVSLVVVSACVRTPRPIKFSILGDSYSAYKDNVYPDSNIVFQYDEIGVTGVEQMWWWQVADSIGWQLDKNNSFSGAMISNAPHYFDQNSFIRRMDNLGNPDVVFIFGGTNDVRHNVPFGDYVYSDWTDEQLRTFRPALAYLFDNMKRLYPKAKLYFILETNPWPGETSAEARLDLMQSVHRIAYHYRVDCIELYDLPTIAMHPTAIGQKCIANQVIDYIVTASER